MQRRNQIKFAGKKFRLKELIDNYPTSVRRDVKEDLIYFLKISEKTFERIMYAKEGDNQEISGKNLLIISDYFDIHPKEFYIKSATEELEDFKNLRKKLNLVK